MTEPTPRQVLYALVAGGFLLVMAILVVGAAVAGLVPGWWTLLGALCVLVAGLWSSLRWRNTVGVLTLAIGLLVLWVIGTLLLAR